METLPALLFFAIVFFIPESPRWLIVRNREERAVNIFGAHFTALPKKRWCNLNENEVCSYFRNPIRVVLAFVAGYYESRYYWCMYSHPRTVYGSECSLVLWSFHL